MNISRMFGTHHSKLKTTKTVRNLKVKPRVKWASYKSRPSREKQNKTKREEEKKNKKKQNFKIHVDWIYLQ